MVSLKHKKVSAKADGGDSTQIRPADWNAEHDLVTAGSSVYLGHDSSAPGAAQELPVDGVGSADFTMVTKYRVQQLIAAAIAAIPPTGINTGDLCASLAASKLNWVLCNGQTVTKANGETNHALFDLLWAINGATWPVLPSRGASAALDWDALKTIAVPDARGCTFGMLDLASGVNALITLLGTKVGGDKVSLTVAQMPQHDHAPNDGTSGTPVATAGSVLNGSQTGVSGNLYNVVRTGKTGGDPAALPPNSVPVPVNVTQPTMGVNIFIKL